MNLFLVGLNLSESNSENALAELKRMSVIYPLLDFSTLWHRKSRNGAIFCASVHTNNEAAAPRCYKSAKEDEIIFYSGLPIEINDNFAAHDAKALSLHWDKIPDCLEGMYCIVKLKEWPSQLEVINDIVGIEQIYYYQENKVWIISNSVLLIDRIVGKLPLDPLGVSLFLSTSWVSDDSTLKHKIKTIPGGQHWKWKEGDSEPHKKFHYSPASLAALPKKNVNSFHWNELISSLGKTIKSLSKNFETVRCALTGGRDSRMVLSLLLNSEKPALFYTFGEPGGTDAKIARHIAQTLKINYKLISVTTLDVLNRWNDISQQIIFHGDGMANIDLIPTVIACISMYDGKLYVDSGGTGGELAKAFYSTPDINLFLHRYKVSTMYNNMVKKLVNIHGGIFTKECHDQSVKYISDFIKKYLEYGFSLEDIPDLYFLYSRLRRKRGSNKRVYNQYQDFFSPYITRSFLEAVFSISPQQRLTQPLHYNIIRILSKELHELPFDKGHWKSQIATMHFINYYEKEFKKKIYTIMQVKRKTKDKKKLIHTATDMFDLTNWFKTKRISLREQCLDMNNSMVWKFADRSIFEKITSPDSDNIDLSQFGMYVNMIFRIATLIQYEATK